MSQKKLRRLEWEWQAAAVDVIREPLAGDAAFALRGPREPSLYPLSVKSTWIEDRGSRRPLGLDAASAMADWYSTMVPSEIVESGTGVGVRGDLAYLLAEQVPSNESLVIEATDGAAVRQYTYYSDSWPFHSWVDSEPWELEFTLNTGSDGRRDWDGVLEGLRAWFDAVPDTRAGFRSVLVGMDPGEATGGRWLDCASRVGSDSQVFLDLGSYREAEELYWTTGACDQRTPTLRELDFNGAHVFAVAGGRSGFVSMADPDGVRAGAWFLEPWNSELIETQRPILIKEGYSTDTDYLIDQLHHAVPQLRSFYQQAAELDQWVMQLSYVDGRPDDIASVRIER